MRVRLNPADLERVAAAETEVDFEESLARAIRRRPADVCAIVEFFDVPTGDAFDVAPEKAIGYFKAKGLQPTFSYADMIGEEHDKAFTVAKMMKVDMLAQVRNSLDSALANGTSFAEWSKSIMPVLQSGGWWGKKKVVDPDTGRIVEAQLGSAWRLETIFRTNMQTAYAAGAWQEITAQADVAPFLMYDAVDDFRTRPMHRAWDRKVLPVDSPWWKTHYPPNGYNCRCTVIQLDADQVQALGLEVARQPPNDGVYLWTNPRTGYATPVPNGIDPGFDRNAGMNYAVDVQKLLDEKIGALPPDMQEAAKSAAMQAQKEIDAAQLAAIKAQDELAAIQARAALERMKAKAAEQAQQLAAADEIDAIAASGAKTGPLGYQAKALATLKQGGTWAELKPTEQLQQIKAAAADLKAKQDLQKAVSLYKTQAVAGKTPSPAATKAFNSLPADEQAALLKKIDDEKAAIAAKKAAEAEAAAKQAAEDAAKAAAAAPPAPPPTVLAGGDPPNPPTMTKIGAQKGSNPGGEYVDTDTGAKWYVKQPASAEIARNEVLAAKLYQIAGVDVPELHLIELDGKTSIASRIVDGLTKGTASQLAAAPGTAEGFVVDAWLGNWDVVGLGYDNLLIRGARAFRVDTGGALRFRAQGSLKGAAWGDDVLELDSLRSPATNRQSFEVFGKLTPTQIEDAAVAVLKVRESQIRALVEQFGPLNPAERRALAERLIARQDYIARKFPAAQRRAEAELGAAVEPPKPVSRVTEAEQRQVEAARVNGYGFATDSDQIEDNMVVVHTFKRVDGTEATRGFFKLLPSASASLAAEIAATAGDAAAVPLAAARDSILSAVKSINFRADKSQPLDQTVVSKITAAVSNIDAAAKALRTAAAKATNPTALLAKADELEQWRKILEPVFVDAKAGKLASKLGHTFDTGAFPDELAYTPKSAAPGAPAGIKWKRVAGPYQFTTAKFDRSFATETGTKAGVAGTALRYEAELADGTRVVYFPHDSANAWAMQGVVKIDAPGRGIASTERVFGTISEIGLKSTRATEVDRQMLYLNAFARIRLLRKGDALARFQAITETGDAGVRARLDFLKRETGVDVEKSEGWKTVDGVRQAFGHGRAYQFRPDLTGAELEDLNRTHVVYHNPQGLGTDAGSGVFERLKTVIEGGGMFASLTDRVRRGVPLSGSSVSSDLASGGGDYHFTRIRARANQGGTGVYWKPTVLRRMDAITYDSDQFGRTTAGHVETYRQGQTVASFKGVAGSSGNETIFKGGLSIFDDLDRIVLSSAAEVKEAIAWLKARGYTTWPDGRKLEEVIMTKAQHSAKP